MRLADIIKAVEADPELALEITNNQRLLNRSTHCSARRGPEKTVFFLDVDEVIVTERAALMGFTVCPMAVALINKLAIRFGAKIVLCSTWGSHVEGHLNASKLLEGFGFHPLVSCGSASWNSDDYKIDTIKGNGRGEQVKLWLERHPEVTNYVIIDDSWCDYPDCQDRVVGPDPLEGFSVRDYYRVIYILNGEEEIPGHIKPFTPRGCVSGLLSHLEEYENAKRNG